MKMCLCFLPAFRNIDSINLILTEKIAMQSCSLACGKDFNEKLSYKTSDDRSPPIKSLLGERIYRENKGKVIIGREFQIKSAQ